MLLGRGGLGLRRRRVLGPPPAVRPVVESKYVSYPAAASSAIFRLSLESSILALSRAAASRCRFLVFSRCISSSSPRTFDLSMHFLQRALVTMRTLPSLAGKQNPRHMSTMRPSTFFRPMYFLPSLLRLFSSPQMGHTPMVQSWKHMVQDFVD